MNRFSIRHAELVIERAELYEELIKWLKADDSLTIIPDYTEFKTTKCVISERISKIQHQILVKDFIMSYCDKYRDNQPIQWRVIRKSKMILPQKYLRYEQSLKQG